MRDGTIDIIATDHAPHALEEKEQPFEAAPFGVTGLETAFPVLYTELVQPGLLRLETVVERMTTGPVRGLRAGAAAARRRGHGRPRAVGPRRRVDGAAGALPLAQRATPRSSAGALAGLCLLTLAGGQVAFREAAVEALP